MNEATLVTPFEFDAPVEFILVATVGKRRNVVARSKGAQMDLIAHAQGGKFTDGETDTPFPFVFPFPFPVPLHLRPLKVNSSPRQHTRDADFDDRTSEYTLVWRGVGSQESRRRVEDIFESSLAGIIEALDERSKPRLEWTLAPVIDLCNCATASRSRRHLRFVYAFWFTLIVYALVIGVFFVTRFLR